MPNPPERGLIKVYVCIYLFPNLFERGNLNCLFQGGLTVLKYNMRSVRILRLFLLPLFPLIFSAYTLNKILEIRCSPLFVSKHHASYGVFIDSMDVLKEQKITNFQKQFNLEEDNFDEEVSSFKSGTDLRKNRFRNLQEVKSLQSPVKIHVVPHTSKKSYEEIDTIITCLNLSYGMKERSELSEEERVGLIDWEKFDEIASDRLGSEYLSSSAKLKNWILFHRKKKDISFQQNTFVWTAKSSSSSNKK